MKPFSETRQAVSRVLALTCLICTSASAAEVTVQNDSVANFGQAVIVGDFAPGEMAGSRLISPCDGSIVAVQVIWLEPPGAGTQPSLERAIRIFASGGTHPVPGTQLLLLDAPLLTAGAINEFRYLDEDNTIPINVPVTLNQDFYVVLEFDNATDVGGTPGTASVVRDVDGCQLGHNVLYGNVGFGSQWYDFCGFPVFLQGDLAIRAVIDCGEPTGACCAPDASCTNDVEEGNCQGTGETFFVGQDCSQVSCPLPTGACCDGTGGCLDDIERRFCETTLSSIYAGDGTTCASDACVTGACCLPDGSCAKVIEVICADLGGIFEGTGTDCTTTSCPQPLGACCVNGNCIPSQTELNCVSFNGQWQGAFTDCGPPDPCVCDDGDGNQDGRIDLLDFTIFQTCHGGSADGICACLDMNNDGVVDDVDLQLFVAALTGP